MPVQNYCHQCARVVRLQDTDLICADCGGDFIEQEEVPFHLDAPEGIGYVHGHVLAEDFGRPPRPGAAQIPEVIPLYQFVDTIGHLPRHERMQNQRSPRAHPLPREPAPAAGFGLADFFNFMNNRPMPQTPPQVPQPSSPHAARIEIHVGGEDGPNGPGGANGEILGMLQNLVQRFGAPNVNLQIHVDGPNMGGGTFQLGDYVVGNNMDQLLNELMQQFGDGQPQQGISEENLKFLPIVKVSQQHVDNKTQCSTCFEDYVLNEEVAQLKCNHIFHPNCVKPWLITHNTCPVCRDPVDPKDWGIPAESVSNDTNSTPASAPSSRSNPAQRPSSSSNDFVEEELD